MHGISRYIYDQVLGPIIFFTFVFAGVVWLSQSLRMLDLVINQGQNALIFLYLTMLSMPGLLALIIPFAVFWGVLYALNRLYTESEIVVMSAAGFSRWAIVKPAVYLSVLAMLVSYVLYLLLMPLGMRELKDRVFEIRADLINTFIKEGAFTTPLKGLTVYVSERGGGEIRGILVHDARKANGVATYMAERGMLAQTPEGPRLIMFNGNIQWVEGGPGGLKVLNFEKYTFDLRQLDKQRTDSAREASERYLPELFWPQGEVSAKERRRFFAEAHERLTAPLYCVIFGLIGALAVVGGTFDRRGYGGRIGLAIAAFLVARLGGFGLLSLVRGTPDMWPILYVWPALWLGGLFYYTISPRFQRWPARAAAPQDGAVA
jgi:lipopolysaccharide export system permease protein